MAGASTGLRELAVPPPLSPMLATLTRALPGGDCLYEPKWDGFRCVAFRAGNDTLFSSRNHRPLDRYFPELVEGLLALAEQRVVCDGEIVASGPGGLDFASLMLRLHPSGSRVSRLRRETPASFVVFDLLAVGDEDLRRLSLAERRARMLETLGGAPPVISVTPATDDLVTAESWLERFTGGGVDGVMAKDVGSGYEAGRRSKAWLKVKPTRTADCVVGGFRWVEGRPFVASLLLGLYDTAGALRHVSVAASFSAARRRELVEELRPAVTSVEGHPWEHGFALERGPMGRLKGSAGAWDPATMAQDWVPLRPELVCEVGYDQVDATGRWRHPARFLRWRPDRDPTSCTFEQIRFSPPELAQVLGRP
ncbi:MAG TPA: ATP-dependent DNA ligase [Acidimicrobiales bacterium]|nr:ATP-dependent DNA ligase [Acidimicrobiales bacterium]